LLVVGAGRTGQYFAWQLLDRRRESSYRLVGFADDDLAKVGMCIHGLEVLGSCRAIPRLVAKHNVDLIAIAADDIDARERQAVLDLCANTAARVKVIPDIVQIIQDLDESPAVKAGKEDPCPMLDT
jgi:FlaA1/EpsC-like NDP-sugar epimerase